MAAWGQVRVETALLTPPMRLQCWGDFALTDPSIGTDFKPRGRKARALLAYLALHAGKPISRERLTGLLWGDRGEEQARASLRQAILEIKPLTLGGVIAVERDHLTLLLSNLDTDVGQMQKAVAAGDYDELLSLLPDRDERLFANLDGLDEAFDDWLTIERSRQGAALITLVADASAAALSKGQTRVARALHARLREYDPAAETLADAQVPSPEASRARTGLTEPVPARIPLLRRGSAAIIACAMAMLVIAAGYWWSTRQSTEAAPPTVAVLPFEGVAGENASFAEGLSEEITSQLARQPGLRIAGRTSVFQLRAQTADLRRLGRRLHVGYLLEGSVRTAGNRVRVNVALTKTADGLQFWGDSFEGKIDDVLAIQYRIAASVAKALDQQLVGAPTPTGTLATSGQVYSLYLTARGLIRERNAEANRRARANLEKAVAIDPRFAPGWSSLAQSEYPGGDVPDSAALARSVSHAQRALALAPDLPEAHAVLGMVYGFDDPVGQQHIQRAAALDPNNAEYQFWLGNVFAEQANFGAMLEAYRRAYALDPLWTRPQDYLVQMSWAMDYKSEARSISRRSEMDGSAAQSHLVQATLAAAQSDLSESVRQLALASQVAADRGRKSDAEWRRAMVLEQLGLVDQSYAIRRRYGETLPPAANDPLVAIRRGQLPTLQELTARNRNTVYAWRDSGYVGRAAKLLIKAGRARDVITVYDRDGLLQVGSKRQSSTSRLLEVGPLIAAALRDVGRTAEADRLLDQMDRRIEQSLRTNRDRVPARFLATAAQTWALRGEGDRAMSALEQALLRGWLYVAEMDDSSLSDFGDEPAYKSLRGNPRFEAIRARINGGLARERREVIAAGLARPSF